MIKVGLIGGGGIADAHIRGYRTYADAIEVTAVADVVDQTARRRAAELDAVAYLDFRQMILEAWPLLGLENTSCARSRSA